MEEILTGLEVVWLYAVYVYVWVHSSFHGNLMQAAAACKLSQTHTHNDTPAYHICTHTHTNIKILGG